MQKAFLAQSVEQLIRNEQVAGSSPVRGSKGSLPEPFSVSKYSHIPANIQKLPASESDIKT